jgi:ribose transport system substrate-binding protein
MTSMRGLLSRMLLSVATAMLPLIACTDAAHAAAKGSKVILLTVSESCEYCARHQQAFKAAATAAGINLDVKINNFDPAEQANQIDQAIAQRPDALVVWPADATAIVPSLRKIKAANIPLVVTNSMPDPKFQSLWNIYTGPNDVANGETAAAVMKKGFEEKGYGPTGTIFVILGVLGTPPQIQRLDGFGKGLASIAPGVKISGSQPGDWDQTKATDAAAALFTQLGDTVKGVYAEADNMLAGVIIAAQRAGRDPSKLVLVGSNCSIEGVKAIEEGVQYGTVLQSPVEDGTYAAQAVADLLDGKPVEKTRFLPHPAITKANLTECNAAVGR